MGGRRRNQQDHFGRRAKKERYPARSVYKLQEINDKLHLLRPHMNVIDLGAAPGSWSIYTAQKVAPGKVLAVDLQKIEFPMPANVITLKADCFELDHNELIALTSKSHFDAVISDMAPATSGHRFTDQMRSYNLFCEALNVAEQLVVPGGHFVGKIFTGEEFDNARDKVREMFVSHKIVRPQSVRTESYETYIVGINKRA